MQNDLQLLKNILVNNRINIVNQKDILIKIIEDKIARHNNITKEFLYLVSISGITIPFLLKDIKFIYENNIQQITKTIFLIILAIYCTPYIIKNYNNALKSKIFFLKYILILIPILYLEETKNK